MKKNYLLLLVILLPTSFLVAQTKFVTIGNSITHGQYVAADLHRNTIIGDSLREMSYRFWFWEKVDSAGINATMVGTMTKYHNQPAIEISQKSRYTGNSFVNNHEAFYGIKSDQFIISPWGYKSFPERLLAYMPDVALINIGHNDDEARSDLTETNIKTIITQLRDRNPDIKILLSSITSSWKSALNARIPKIVKDMTTSKSVVVFVDMTTGYQSNPEPSATTMTLDWVHPNARGQKFMANRWFDAYIKVIKEESVAPSVPTNVKAANVTATTATVTWTGATDNTGVNVYKVYVNDVFVGETGNTSLDITGQDFSVESVIKVTAVDYQNNESAKSIGYNVPIASSVSSELWQFVKLYPVPASDYVIIDGASGSVAEMIDLLGKSVLTMDIQSDQQRIHVKSLNEGYYLMNIRSGNQKMNRTVIIRR